MAYKKSVYSESLSGLSKFRLTSFSNQHIKGGEGGGELRITKAEEEILRCAQNDNIRKRKEEKDEKICCSNYFCFCA
jgi:hypothetical protein